MLFFLLFLTITWGHETCIHTQGYWLSNASLPWPLSPFTNRSLQESTLCGISWSTLMFLNASQAHDPNALEWLLAFHQLCTATLNWYERPPNTTSILATDVELAIDFIHDSMQRRCDNITSWTLAYHMDSVLRSKMNILVRYNHLNKVCENAQQDSLAFAFEDAPELFIINYTNDTARHEAEVLTHLYKIQTLLVIFALVVGFVCIPLLFVYILMLRNQKREYSLFPTTTEMHTFNASGGDEGNVNLTDTDEEENAKTK
jgi:hypothetical protein